jgi:hypothetical protein
MSRGLPVISLSKEDKEIRLLFASRKRLPIPTILPLPRRTPPLDVKTFMQSLEEQKGEKKEDVKGSIDDDGDGVEAEKVEEKVEEEEMKRKTTVVCVKVASIRPHYQDLKEWMADPQNVYIARKGVVLLDNPETGKKARFPPADSKFANPFTVKDHGLEKCIELYRVHIKKQIAEGKITRAELDALKGKTLGCWCKPGPCHGDVLLEFI